MNQKAFVLTDLQALRICLAGVRVDTDSETTNNHGIVISVYVVLWERHERHVCTAY